tara:strand:+ start:554 stop:1075 length:522 start_codon:yes stop_codon:yes gene_type:complete
MKDKKPTFEQAINIASLWCKAWEEGQLSDEILAERISELIADRNGARGFFVVGLATDNPLLDRLPEPLIFKLRQAKEPIIDLTVRNLAMSSAMALEHKRNGNTSLQTSSERISSRCIELLRLLDPVYVKERIENLLAATNGSGEDLNFLERWGYDKEQKQAIATNLISIAENN